MPEMLQSNGFSFDCHGKTVQSPYWRFLPGVGKSCVENPASLRRAATGHDGDARCSNNSSLFLLIACPGFDLAQSRFEVIHSIAADHLNTKEIPVVSRPI